MVYFGDELELWRFEGVIRGEVNVQEEHTAGEGRVVWSHDGSLPVEGIRFVLRASRAVGRWVLAQIDKFFLDALKCHFIMSLNYEVYGPLLNPRRTTKSLINKLQIRQSQIWGFGVLGFWGFGVDALYFSQKVNFVTHCEINNELSQIVSHNLEQLNVTNIKTQINDGIEFLKKSKEKYDWIYTDPSRRNDAKGKVFLLEDCLPNIPENLDILFKKTDNILIKVSPILDITSAINEIKFIKEIHCISVKNEVKELLFILEKNYYQSIKIQTINFTKKGEQVFSFQYNEDISASFSEPKKYLFEPNSAILKAGGFSQISQQLKIDKLHKHSHLYTSNKLIDFPGRYFEIIHEISYDKKLLKKLIPSKKANITTRNFPETVDQIRKKTGIKDGGNQYLFFTTNFKSDYIVLICKKI